MCPKGKALVPIILVELPFAFSNLPRLFMKKSDLITEWNHGKQMRRLVTLCALLLTLVAVLIARLAYLSNN